MGRNYPIAAIHERDYLQERLQIAAERHRENCERKRRRRRRIPEEGLILNSKEEIQQYFDEREAKSKSTQLNKLQKPMGRADKLDIRLRELVAKRRNIRQERKKEKASNDLEINSPARRGETEGSGPFEDREDII